MTSFYVYLIGITNIYISLQTISHTCFFMNECANFVPVTFFQLSLVPHVIFPTFANGTAHFEISKPLHEYQNLLLTKLHLMAQVLKSI